MDPGRGAQCSTPGHRKHGKTDGATWKPSSSSGTSGRYLIDPEHGGWYEETTRESARIGDGRKAQPWKANYHTGRAMMNVVTMLGEIAYAEPR
ncbi:MAG: hypothetical protein U0800_26155 [Isosphaeraceae bacterium]